MQAYLMYGRLLDALGRAGEALEMKLRAFERDPFSALVHVQIAQCCWNQRRYDEAIEWARRALAFDARHLLAREFLASAYLFKDDFDRYLAEMIAHGAAHDLPAEQFEPLKIAYEAGGRSWFFRYCAEEMSKNRNCRRFSWRSSIRRQAISTPRSTISIAPSSSTILLWSIWRWRRSGRT